MNTADLEQTYTALAECIARIGRERAAILLATLSLDLLNRLPDAAAALEHIRRAESLART